MNIDLSDGKIPNAPEHTDNLRIHISTANMPLVWSEDIARKWAEVLLEAYFGADALTRQHPLEVTDDGDGWTILGSWNCDRAIRGSHDAFSMHVWKYDGRVIAFCMPTVVSEGPLYKTNPYQNGTGGEGSWGRTMPEAPDAPSTVCFAIGTAGTLLPCAATGSREISRVGALALARKRWPPAGPPSGPAGV